MLIIKHQRDYTEFRRVYFLTECFIVSRRIRRKRRLAHTLRLCCWRLCRMLAPRRLHGRSKCASVSSVSSVDQKRSVNICVICGLSVSITMSFFSHGWTLITTDLASRYALAGLRDVTIALREKLFKFACTFC